MHLKHCQRRPVRAPLGYRLPRPLASAWVCLPSRRSAATPMRHAAPPVTAIHSLQRLHMIAACYSAYLINSK